MGISVHATVRRGATGAALAALVLGGGAVGCSKSKAEDEPKMAPAAAVARAAKNSEDITSLRYRMSGTVPESGRVKATAAMNMEPLAMSMKITAAGQDGGTTELRLVDKAMYLGGGEDAAKELDGKHWMKFDMSGMAERGDGSPGFDASKLSDQADQNPAQESTFLSGSKDVKKVGAEKVDGVETTHYKGTVTLDALRASFKDEKKSTRERREKSLKQYEDLGIDKLTMDMWIDGDDHTKQFRTRADADKGPFDVTITFLDFNKPVSIKAPAAGDTVDLAEMLKGAQG
ncbi:DUF1396 domain-containing protein [Streptomyces sp. Tue6028]|uniref:DUF1396 domain-containing protein n=1 Tax=Streptomyces sp. Tue6028 TaxID=2036037 RepID=UPI003D71C2BD